MRTKLDNRVKVSILTRAVDHGAVAQLEERYNRTVEVRGSSPLSSTSYLSQPDMGL